MPLHLNIYKRVTRHLQIRHSCATSIGPPHLLLFYWHIKTLYYYLTARAKLINRNVSSFLLWSLETINFVGGLLLQYGLYSLLMDPPHLQFLLHGHPLRVRHCFNLHTHSCYLISGFTKTYPEKW